MSSFPDNILDEIQDALETGFNDGRVFLQRPVRFDDPDRTVSLFSDLWTPNEQSVEIGPQFEPVLSRYNFRVQTYNKVFDYELGRKEAAIDAKIVRAILYRDTTLALRLYQLTETLLGSREVLKRFGVARTRFMNNEIQGSFLFLSTTDIWSETEITKL